MTQQTESFLREYHYLQAQELYRLLDEHPWSRRLSQRDAGSVAEAQRQAQVLAGDLYHLRKELTARLAAADEVAAALAELMHDITHRQFGNITFTEYQEGGACGDMVLERAALALQMYLDTSRLIAPVAAAPRLLAALEDLIGVATQLPALQSGSWEAEVIEEARAALAAARGEE